uniref:Uncharacterized protein n=1 Tax=Sarcoptes scabiei TaxID=52283 RepID=A0A834R814_SARSC
MRWNRIEFFSNDRCPNARRQIALFEFSRVKYYSLILDFKIDWFSSGFLLPMIILICINFVRTIFRIVFSWIMMDSQSSQESDGNVIVVQSSESRPATSTTSLSGDLMAKKSKSQSLMMDRASMNEEFHAKFCELLREIRRLDVDETILSNMIQTRLEQRISRLQKLRLDSENLWCLLKQHTNYHSPLTNHLIDLTSRLEKMLMVSENLLDQKYLNNSYSIDGLAMTANVSHHHQYQHQCQSRDNIENSLEYRISNGAKFLCNGNDDFRNNNNPTTKSSSVDGLFNKPVNLISMHSTTHHCSTTTIHQLDQSNSQSKIQSNLSIGSSLNDVHNTSENRNASNDCVEIVRSCIDYESTPRKSIEINLTASSQTLITDQDGPNDCDSENENVNNCNQDVAKKEINDFDTNGENMINYESESTANSPEMFDEEEDEDDDSNNEDENEAKNDVAKVADKNDNDGEDDGVDCAIEVIDSENLKEEMDKSCVEIDRSSELYQSIRQLVKNIDLEQIELMDNSSELINLIDPINSDRSIDFLLDSILSINFEENSGVNEESDDDFDCKIHSDFLAKLSIIFEEKFPEGIQFRLNLMDRIKSILLETLHSDGENLFRDQNKKRDREKKESNRRFHLKYFDKILRWAKNDDEPEANQEIKRFANLLMLIKELVSIEFLGKAFLLDCLREILDYLKRKGRLNPKLKSVKKSDEQENTSIESTNLVLNTLMVLLRNFLHQIKPFLRMYSKESIQQVQELHSMNANLERFLSSSSHSNRATNRSQSNDETLMTSVSFSSSLSSSSSSSLTTSATRSHLDPYTVAVMVSDILERLNVKNRD